MAMVQSGEVETRMGHLGGPSAAQEIDSRFDIVGRFQEPTPASSAEDEALRNMLLQLCVTPKGSPLQCTVLQGCRVTPLAGPLPAAPAPEVSSPPPPT